MLYKRRWYFGTVVMTEVDGQQASNQIQPACAEYSSEYDEPLCNLAKRLNATFSLDDDPFKNYDIEEPNDPDFVWPPIRPRTDFISSDATVCADEVNSIIESRSHIQSSHHNLNHKHVKILVVIKMFLVLALDVLFYSVGIIL